MEQCSTQQLIRSTRAFEERVRYWKSKGLTQEQAELRAQKKNENFSKIEPSRPAIRKITRHTVKPRFINSSTNPNNSRTPEPTDEQVQEVLSKLFETGQATLLNSYGQVIEPSQFKKSAEKPVKDQRDQLKSVLRLSFPALQVILSSSLLLGATITALGGWTLENAAIAIVLETGLLSLALTRSNSLWSVMGMRLGAILIMVLGFFVLHSRDKLAHNQQIAHHVIKDSNVDSIRSVKSKLEDDLKALPATHRTARNELLVQIDAKQKELDSALSAVTGGEGIGALKQLFWTLVLTRVALQLLNVFFGHNLITQMRKEGILT